MMRRLWMVLTVTALVALGGCDRAEEPAIASAADGPQVAAPSPTGSTPAGSPGAVADPREAGKAFVGCMRERGQEIIDPPVADDPRSAIRHELDVNGKGDNMDFQAALDACLPILPPPPPPSREKTAEAIAVDEALRAYAACLRANGLPDYPDLTAIGEERNGYAWVREGEIPEVPAQVERKCRKEVEKLDAAQEKQADANLRRK